MLQRRKKKQFFCISSKNINAHAQRQYTHAGWLVGWRARLRLARKLIIEIAHRVAKKRCEKVKEP